MMFPVEIHLVSAVESPEFTLMETYLLRSTVVGLDAEWKPVRRGEHKSNSSSVSKSSDFPTVTVLQIACRYQTGTVGKLKECVFLVDLMSVPAVAVWEMLKDMFVSPDIVKLGFRFKQDLVYLSSTFSSMGCHPGFDKVVPFLDINNIYHHLENNNSVKKRPKETKSLSAICKELLDVSLSKELQCSDWSARPLTEAQMLYAAADAYYLLKIFDVFQCSITNQGSSTPSLCMRNMSLGLKEIFNESNASGSMVRMKFSEASDMVKSSGLEILSLRQSTMTCWPSSESGFGDILTKIVEVYSEQILLKESDRKPRSIKREGKQSLAVREIQDQNVNTSIWEGPPPWDSSVGGDGCPKFLCDVMIEGLAKHLRCVGFDAAVPSSRKPETRQLINQAHKEKRVILTRDVKLLKHQYLIRNQVYKLKSLLKNEQLVEVIDTFQLKVCEDQLMSRCTKCNGSFIQKPLTIEEAIEASKGFQVIPGCIFKKDLEFWQCMDCKQIYWEGTQYHNAIQKFIDVCKLNN